MWKMGGDKERFTGSRLRFFFLRSEVGKLVSFQRGTVKRQETITGINNINFQDERKGGVPGEIARRALLRIHFGNPVNKTTWNGLKITLNSTTGGQLLSRLSLCVPGRCLRGAKVQLAWLKSSAKSRCRWKSCYLHLITLCLASLSSLSIITIRGLRVLSLSPRPLWTSYLWV